jgi:hypothetical protein
MSGALTESDLPVRFIQDLEERFNAMKSGSNIFR